MKFKPGDFATCQGQIVKITKLKVLYSLSSSDNKMSFQVKLLNNSHTYWVYEHDLEALSKQKVPKILYG